MGQIDRAAGEVALEMSLYIVTFDPLDVSPLGRAPQVDGVFESRRHRLAPLADAGKTAPLAVLVEYERVIGEARDYCVLIPAVRRREVLGDDRRQQARVTWPGRLRE